MTCFNILIYKWLTKGCVVMVQHAIEHTSSNANMWDCLYRETLDHRVPQAKMVLLDSEASLEKEVYLVLR